MRIDIVINGQDHQVETHPGTSLLELLRQMGLHNVNDAGNDAVLVDGKLISSGIYLAAQAHKRSVVTVEGLGTTDNLHPIQKAFLETGSASCGLCSSAMILATHELLCSNPQPTDADAREALSGILSRCTDCPHPVEAVLLAAQKIRDGANNGTPSCRPLQAASQRVFIAT